MKKITRLFLSITMMMLMLAVFPLKADAAAYSSEDGLEVSIETDKDEYSSKDDINISVDIKNTNTYDMTGISVETLLPEGIKVKNGVVNKDNITVPAGESVNVNVVAELKEATVTPNETENLQSANNQTGAGNSADTSKKPVKTGDNSRVFMWISLVLVSVVGLVAAYAVKTKKFKKFLSAFLCVALVAGCIVVTDTQKTFAKENTTISVDKTIKADGNDYNLAVNVMFEKVTKYIVSFESNGGSEVESQIILSGKAALPNEPQREGYTFAGWYTDNVTFENEFDFNTVIDKDYTLYAMWTPVYGEFDNEPVSGSMHEVTSYSITGLEIDKENNTATAIVSAPENCAVVVRFIDEEIYFSSSYPENKEYIDNGDTYASHVVEAGTYVEEVVSNINNEIPEHFVAEAVLIDANGNALCDPYSNIDNTERHEEFERKTIYDFGDDVVLNYDPQTNDNFGVLADDVKVLTADEIIYNEETEVYTIKNSSEAIAANDKIFIRDNNGYYLFKVKTVDVQDGVATVTKTKADDAETGFELADFYKYIKVDKTYEGEINEENEAEEEAVAPQSDDSICTEVVQNTYLFSGFEVYDAYVDGSAETSISVSPISFESDHFTADGKVTGTIGAEIEIEWDIVIFGEDYMKCDFTYSTEVETKISILAKIGTDDEEAEVVNKELRLGKIRIPFGVTGLDAFAEMKAELSWELSAGIEATGNIKTEHGFKYNTKDGKQKVEESEDSWTLDAKGSVEIKFGPAPSVGVEFLDGVIKAELECFFGVKGEGEVVVPIVAEGSDSIHACNACVDGKVSGVVEVGVKLSYKITKHLKGTPLDWTIVSLEKKLFDFYLSLINPVDSEYHGKVKFGLGECENKLYRTTVFASDTNNQSVSTEVKIYGSTGAFNKKLTSGGHVYLAPGDYVAKATIDGIQCEKSFTIGDCCKVVRISATERETKVSGSVVEAGTENNGNAIANATVTVYEGSRIVKTTTTDESGRYSFVIDPGTYRLSIYASGYIPASQTVTVEEGEDKHIDLLLMAKKNSDEIMGGIYGNITDAVTGNRLSDVSVKISKGWANEVNTTEFVKEEKTDYYGNYSCRKTPVYGVNFGLDAGNYTITISKEGYIPTTFNVVIVGGVDLEFNSTITPVGEEDVYRVVLTWGEYPWDLDSHLNGTYNGERDHIYYRRKDGDASNLDVDDTTSYGPETVTIPDIEAYTGKITYAVHDYTNRDETECDKMSKSGATVKVYKGGNLLKTFYIPSGVQGTVWNVFYFDENHNIVPVNTFEFESEPDNVD